MGRETSGAVGVAVLCRSAKDNVACEQRPGGVSCRGKSMSRAPRWQFWPVPGTRRPVCLEKREPGNRWGERSEGIGGSDNVGTLDFTPRWEAWDSFFLFRLFS